MNKQRILAGAAWLVGCKVASYATLLLTFGTHTVIFSGFTLLAPITGTLFALPYSLAITLILLLSKSGTSMYAATFGIPTIIAMFCWTIEYNPTKITLLLKTILHIIVPLICMILFIKHPIGKQAFFYALYWLVPVCLFLAPKKYPLWSTAVSISFITHAIGSILWLHTFSTTPLFWQSLIPVVAFERLFISATTIGLIYLLRLGIKKHFFLSKTCLTNPS